MIIENEWLVHLLNHTELRYIIKIFWSYDMTAHIESTDFKDNPRKVKYSDHFIQFEHNLKTRMCLY